MKTKKIVWYARSGNIAKMGPYKSQIEATNAIRLAPAKPVDPLHEFANAVLGMKYPLPALNQLSSGALFHDNAFVWPEEE
jgi:hypothetical protein